MPNNNEIVKKSTGEVSSERSYINCIYHHVCYSILHQQSYECKKCGYYKDYSEIIDLNPDEFSRGDVCIWSDYDEDGDLTAKYVVKIVDIPMTSEHRDNFVKVKIIKKLVDNSRKVAKKNKISLIDFFGINAEDVNNCSLTTNEKKVLKAFKSLDPAVSRFFYEADIAKYKEEHKKGSVFGISKRVLEKYKENNKHKN